MNQTGHFIVWGYMSGGGGGAGVYVIGFSDQGVCVLGVSVRGVHVRGVLSCHRSIHTPDDKAPHNPLQVLVIIRN